MRSLLNLFLHIVSKLTIFAFSLNMVYGLIRKNFL